jgi:chaperone modulatory protein CbpM
MKKKEHPTVCRHIDEIAKDCGVAPQVVYQYIKLEWISPYNQESNLLDEEDLARIRLILDLQERLGVNDEAVPIILHLIDQLNHFHRAVRSVERAREQSED